MKEESKEEKRELVYGNVVHNPAALCFLFNHHNQ